MKNNWKDDFEGMEELFEADNELLSDFDAELNRDMKGARRNRREKEKSHKKYGRNESRWN